MRKDKGFYCLNPCAAYCPLADSKRALFRKAWIGKACELLCSNTLWKLMHKTLCMFCKTQEKHLYVVVCVGLSSKSRSTSNILTKYMFKCISLFLWNTTYLLYLRILAPKCVCLQMAASTLSISIRCPFSIISSPVSWRNTMSKKSTIKHGWEAVKASKLYFSEWNLKSIVQINQFSTSK